jgi:hypothetical protein
MGRSRKATSVRCEEFRRLGAGRWGLMNGERTFRRDAWRGGIQRGRRRELEKAEVSQVTSTPLRDSLEECYGGFWPFITRSSENCNRFERTLSRYLWPDHAILTSAMSSLQNLHLTTLFPISDTQDSTSTPSEPDTSTHTIIPAPTAPVLAADGATYARNISTTFTIDPRDRHLPRP